MAAGQHEPRRVGNTYARAPTVRRIAARFETMEGARRAITSLGLAGVDGDYISLGVSAAKGGSSARTGETDARMLLHLLRYIIIGAVIGTVIGVMVSPFVGWLVLLWLGLDVTVQSMLISLLLTTLMSHMIGGFIGYAVAMQAGDSWEQSFHHDVSGPVDVIVRSDRQEVIDRAVRCLRRHQPATIAHAGDPGA